MDPMGISNPCISVIFMVNVGKYAIHGSPNWNTIPLTSLFRFFLRFLRFLDPKSLMFGNNMSPEKGAFLRGQTNVMCQIGSTPLNRGKNRKTTRESDFQRRTWLDTEHHEDLSF